MNKEEFEQKRILTKEEKDKRLVMWSGVIFFMILITFLLFLNTKKVFSRINRTNIEGSSDINEVSERLNKTFEELKKEMNIMTQQIGVVSEELKEETISEDKNINKKSIEALKEKLEASSTDNIYEKE